MAVRSDFLTTSEPVEQQQIDLSRTNRLLQAILAETRKQLAKIACVISVQEGVNVGGQAGVGGINSANPAPARVLFINEGNPVKSFYTVIANNTSGDALVVGINEPVVIGGTGTGNGIVVPTAGVLILPQLEIEWLSMQSAGNTFVPINNVPAGGHGNYTIYAWTLPEYANISN